MFELKGHKYVCDASFNDNFNFDENGRQFSIQVENTVGKGEIARYRKFLLFPQCFQKTSTQDTYKPGLVWERVNLDKQNQLYKNKIIQKIHNSDQPIP